MFSLNDEQLLYNTLRGREKIISSYLAKSNLRLLTVKVLVQNRLSLPDSNEVSTHQPKQNFGGVNIIEISYGRIGP